jgi:hypothetical protein
MAAFLVGDLLFSRFPVTLTNTDSRTSSLGAFNGVFERKKNYDDYS